MKNEQDKLIINVIKTDNGCFISDCIATSGYDYTYHKTKLTDLLFDGEKPTKTFATNWMKINKYPKKVQIKTNDKQVNIRYTLIDPDMESKKLPLNRKNFDDVEVDDYGDDTVRNLYNREYDIEAGKLEDFPVSLEVIMEVENFQYPPEINFDAITRDSWNDKKIKITNANIKHQLLDKLIIPEVMLHTRPCELSSVDMFKLVRSYIKDNIDNKVAKITSDYDFCFTVKKLIPLYQPKPYTYQNLLASKKKDREKIHHAVHTYREVEIFQMTDDVRKYQGYSPISKLVAENEYDLKEKLDTYLKELIERINEPLKACECCEGKGYLNEDLKNKL